MSQQVTGVLLTNLGTPDAPTAAALRRYLGEFLSDPRVVDLPRPIWWLILHGIILRIRPRRSAANYQKVWDGGSPLLNISKQQQQRLLQLLDATEGDKTYKVALGMRYGNPSIASALQHLEQQQVDEIVVLPLYPQFSCSTSASTFDAIAHYYKKRRAIPPLRIVNNYHQHSAYITALANSIEQHFAKHGTPDKLLFSFHGTPIRFREQGDPYFHQCEATTNRVVQQLQLRDTQWQLTFQSRFGREPWLQPYTDMTLQSLAQAGVKSVAVICPGFSADCLETLEEIEGENREIFEHAGGSSFHYIRALNDSPEHIAMMRDLILEA